LRHVSSAAIRRSDDQMQSQLEGAAISVMSGARPGESGWPAPA